MNRSETLTYFRLNTSFLHQYVDNIVMQINFTKMHGLGNDFVVIDAIHQDVRLTGEQYRFIANRRLGIGCDQIQQF